MRGDLREIRSALLAKSRSFQPSGGTLKLSAAIEVYVKRKRDEGLVYDSGAAYLAGLRKQTGDVSLERITTRQISTFLEGPKSSPSTWLGKYHLLRGFFDFWLARGEMEVLPMSVKRNIANSKPFLPYIFTHSEIRGLLNEASKTRKVRRSKIDSITLRTILILLYGTGIQVGEALRLLVEDVDLKKGEIRIHGNRFNRSRNIPIGPELRNLLAAYATPKGANDNHLFQDKKGQHLSYAKLEQMFRRLRRKSGIRRHDEGSFQPRMYDLRHTFAVHRIAGWIKHGANLNRMLPALAVYMGLTGLRSTERYLSFTPERFRTQLDQLSPRRGKKRWRDDPELMNFLSALSDGHGNTRPRSGDVSGTVSASGGAKTASAMAK